MKKLNIGIVCSPMLGGSGVVGSELAKYLAKTNNYKVVFIGSELPFRIDRDEVNFHPVSMVRHALFNSPLNEAALTEGIIEAVLTHKLEIIHAHFAIPFAYCTLQAKEVLKRMGVNIKVVTTLHGTDVLTLGQKLPAVMKYVLEQSDAVTTVSDDLAKKAKKIYRTNVDIQVVYNFLDFAQEPQSSDLERIHRKFAPKGEQIFVHISNFRPIKRVDDTIKVFFKANKKVPSVLLLIGDGPELGTVKRKTESRNKHSIHFIGKVKDPYLYLKLADGLIVTSEYESFCLVALESLRFGVPVFGYKVGGIPEVVKHKRSGYLVRLGETEQLAQYIIKHFSNQDKIEAFKKASEEASHQFSADRIIPQYERIYQKLASTKKNWPPF